MTTVDTPVRRRPIVRAIEGQELALVVVIIVLCVVLSLMTRTFLTASNLNNILFSVAPIAIMGIGMTAVIVTAGIDVSCRWAARRRWSW
ncbi:hypothetical protein [Fodinicola feengrottensis]|uniref:hypothetical protein n=1 Tax=Fodinicola feengrottensis TaxID=435914 RepID=UPI002441A854|nr:hypothetical protein [Fodinicola feengrottensis]